MVAGCPRILDRAGGLAGGRAGQNGGELASGDLYALDGRQLSWSRATGCPQLSLTPLGRHSTSLSFIRGVRRTSHEVQLATQGQVGGRFISRRLVAWHGLGRWAERRLGGQVASGFECGERAGARWGRGARRPAAVRDLLLALASPEATGAAISLSTGRALVKLATSVVPFTGPSRGAAASSPFRLGPGGSQLRGRAKLGHRPVGPMQPRRPWHCSGLAAWRRL